MSGPPASGKTTVAVPLAGALALPLVAKDTIKEALMDALGADNLVRSRELGRATFAVLYALARSHLSTGVGLVLEANFASGRRQWTCPGWGCRASPWTPARRGIRTRWCPGCATG